MANENERMQYSEVDGMEDIDFDELEEKLQNDLDEHLSELEFIKEDREKISNPENLGKTVMNVVWEQFLNQMAVTAGEDFIRENQGLTLDLRSDSHIQTPENFKNEKIAKHNYKSIEDLEYNYDRFKNTHHKEFRETHVDPGMNATLKRAGVLNKEGVDTVTDIYTGRQIPTNTKLENGKNNPKAAQREHVKPSSVVYEDPSLQMAFGDKELAKIINDPDNLQGYTTAERNNRKSDKTADKMESKDLTKRWIRNDEKAEQHVDKNRKEGEERLKCEGEATQKEEAFKITGMALRAVVMQLFAELIKEVIRKLILWFKSAQKNMESLLGSIKLAIKSFISKLKTNLVNAGNTLATTVATAIFGPVVRTIKKAWIMLKQGWKSLKEAIAYIGKPDNKNKPFGVLVLEIGKIVVVGLSAAGAIVLGEVIEKGLMVSVPVFAFEIPLLGSLASLIGLFLGGLVAGIIGAIAISLIDKAVAKQQTELAIEKEVKKGNEVLNKQNLIIDVNESIKEKKKSYAVDTISNRHGEAAILMKDALGKILHEEKNEIIVSENVEEFNKMFNSLKKLQE